LGNSFWQKRFLNVSPENDTLILKETRFYFLVSFRITRNTLHSNGGKKMDTTEDLQKNILDATLRVFDKKGLKFTMDDLAKELSISKKTIYTVYDDKEALFLATVDYIFDSIKESEQMILTDPSLSVVEKLHRILGVLPEGYQNIDLRKLYSLRDKYPKIYQKVELRLSTGWEPTIQLIEMGMAEGSIRPVPICLVKMMLEASIEQFFQRDILAQNGLTYADALKDVVDILMFGIAKRSE